MPSVLRNRTYRHLFTAQVVALVGTGLATVALGLLAYDLAGADASAVLGTALAIKMLAYVLIAPLAAALADRVSRRTLLVSMDLIRAGVALMLPFVDQVWQVYVLILLLQAASAAFTPTFQALVPEVLPDERDYTRALSLSRLAYDLESLLSPVLAAALLSLVRYAWLFTGTAVGFAASAALVVSVLLPTHRKPAAGAPRRQVLRGTRLLFATPRLRALLALDLAVAAAGALVLVDTVVLVRGTLGRPAEDVPLALGAYGAGSMAVALLLPRLLDRRVADRALMLTAGGVLTCALAACAVGLALGPGDWAWPALLVAWTVIGAAGSAVLTPGGRLLRRSAAPGDLPAAFAAHFSLTHACWLLTYPLTGWLTARTGPAAATGALTALALAGSLLARRLWPRTDREPEGEQVREAPPVAGRERTAGVDVPARPVR